MLIRLLLFLLAPLLVGSFCPGPLLSAARSPRQARLRLCIAVRTISPQTLLNLQRRGIDVCSGEVQSKMDDLERLLPGVDVSKLVHGAPTLLNCDVSPLVSRKLKRLQELLPGADLMSVVRRSPMLLCRDVDTLSEKMQQLQVLLPGVDTVSFVSRAPGVLKLDIPGTLARKMELLRELLPETDVVELVAGSPTLLQLNIEETVAKKILTLRRVLSEEQWERLVERGLGRALQCSPAVISRMEMVQHSGCNKGALTILLMPKDKFESLIHAGSSA